LAQGVAPRYEADVTFPQPFPDLWVTGGFGGHCIDAQDHVLLLNRQDVLDGELNSGHLAALMIELVAPSAAKASQSARPMPWAPPVTTTIPKRSLISSWSSRSWTSFMIAMLPDE
jgi:hypothetical protein